MRIYAKAGALVGWLFSKYSNEKYGDATGVTIEILKD
jgi:hypothetical protein